MNFSTDWLTYLLMMASDKHNSRMRATDLISLITNQHRFILRCAFSPTLAATVLALWC